MEFTQQQQNLLKTVKLYHSGQKRRYTDEPYHTHLEAVAQLVLEAAAFDPSHLKLAVEVAFCHDLIEDTHCTPVTLLHVLRNARYNWMDATTILHATLELTDHFTKEDYPTLNRRERKLNESLRLRTISPLSQSVKCADILHNLESIYEYDKGFCKVILKEISTYIPYMRNGNKRIYNLCMVDFMEKYDKLFL